MSEEEGRFVEEMGLILEGHGRPRIAGQILGWLLICDPPAQSFSDLVGALDVSKGSVSSMTRLLLEAGMIERCAVPKDRQTYYRLAPDAWIRVLQRQVQAIEQITAAAERGLALVEGRQSEDMHWRLREMRDLNQIAARQMPKMIEEFERSRERG